MLADKDIEETILEINDVIHHWYIATIPHERGASLEELQDCFYKTNIKNVTSYSTIKDAFHSAHQASKENDTVLIFGSFHTVAQCH